MQQTLQRRVWALIFGFLSLLPIFLAFWQGLVFLVFFLPLPFFAIGLSMGSRSYAISAGTAIAVLALLGGVSMAAGMLMILMAPVGLLVHHALRQREGPDGTVQWYPLGPLVGWLTFCGLVWLVAALVVFMSGESLTIEALVRERLGEAFQSVAPNIPSSDRDLIVAAMAPYGLGFASVTWLGFMAINALLAQWFLTRNAKALRTSPRLDEMEISPWFAIAFGVSVGLAILSDGDLGYAAQNIAVVLAIPFFFGGLAVVHGFARERNSRRMLLIFFYTLMALVSWTAVGVVILGVIDQWVGLRRFFATPGPDREEE